MRLVIDGNIGAGKTTQLDLLESSGYRVRREPIEQWPLELFYSDPKRWGFMFQTTVLVSFRDDYEDNDIVIYERCPSSSKKVFWKAMDHTDVEDDIYKKLFMELAWFPDLYIYIHVPVERLNDRIRQRGQVGDHSVKKDYLTKLDFYYKRMFHSLHTPYKYWLDGTKGAMELHNDIETIIKNYILLITNGK